jgi:hypothetical protein
LELTRAGIHRERTKATLNQKATRKLLVTWQLLCEVKSEKDALCARSANCAHQERKGENCAFKCWCFHTRANLTHNGRPVLQTIPFHIYEFVSHLSFCQAHCFPNNWKIDGDYPPPVGQRNSFLRNSPGNAEARRTQRIAELD